MPSATRAAHRDDVLARARFGAWRRLFGAVCALMLLCVTLTACSTNLLGPVTLADTPAHGVTAPAQIRHGDHGATLVVVEVLIHGAGPYPMALDTGASLTLIDATLADKLGLTAAGAPEQITGVGGAERVTPVHISRWSLGKQQLPSMTITSASLSDLKTSAGVDGLIGSDLLGRFGAVTIDYTDGQVTLYQIASGGASSN